MNLGGRADVVLGSSQAVSVKEQVKKSIAFFLLSAACIRIDGAAVCRVTGIGGQHEDGGGRSKKQTLEQHVYVGFLLPSLFVHMAAAALRS
jgi:hypothetical protein